MNINFSPYRLSDNEAIILNEDFIEIHSDLQLSRISKEDGQSFIANSLKNNCRKNIGVYFWLVNIDKELFKIYIGKTTSLERRLNDYMINFQIHSPNDYKMRFFQDFVLNQYEDAKFCLYFRPCSLDNYTKIETESINSYSPLINKRAIIDKNTKEIMKNAFRDYYEVVFRLKLTI